MVEICQNIGRGSAVSTRWFKALGFGLSVLVFATLVTGSAMASHRSKSPTQNADPPKPTWRKVSDSHTQCSWIGVPIYRLGVKATFQSDGLTITQYGGAQCMVNVWVAWEVKDSAASWTYQDSSEGEAVCEATLRLSIPLTGGLLTLVTFTDDENVRARP